GIGLFNGSLSGFHHFHGLMVNGVQRAYSDPASNDGMRWTPSFRPRSTENKRDSCRMLSLLVVIDCCSFRVSKPFRKERTSDAEHCPSSLSVFLGFSTLPPQAV